MNIQQPNLKPASLTVISAAGVVPIAPRPVAAYFGSDCLRKDQVLSCYTLNCNCGGRGLGLIAQVRVGGATQGQAV